MNNQKKQILALTLGVTLLSGGMALAMEKEKEYSGYVKVSTNIKKGMDPNEKVNLFREALNSFYESAAKVSNRIFKIPSFNTIAQAIRNGTLTKQQIDETIDSLGYKYYSADTNIDEDKKFDLNLKLGALKLMLEQMMNTQ